MENESFTEDLRRYLLLFWHWAWLLALATIVGAAIGYGLSSRITPVYQASTTVLINEAPDTRTSEYAALITSERLASTYAELMTTQPILEGVVKELELGINPRALQSAISVAPVLDTQLVSIRVEDTDPARAAAIADAVVKVFKAWNETIQSERYADSTQTLQSQLDTVDLEIQKNLEALAALGDSETDQAARVDLEASLAQNRRTFAEVLQSREQIRLAEAQSTSNVILVEDAVALASPIRPRPVQNVSLAAMIGLVLAAGLVFLIEALDDTVKGPDDVTRHLGVPVLGLIARVKDVEEGPITATQPRSPSAEAFRGLRTNIQYASVDFPIQSLLITSPSPKDGKTTVSTNLAVALAQSGRNVALVDADLRRPAVHKRMRLSNRKGLSDLFVQPSPYPDGALRETAISGLSVMTSGSLPPNPAELIGSERMLALMRQLQTQADVVLIDSPPVMAVTDAAVLAPRVDGVLLVIRPGATKLGASKQAMEQLRRSGANVLGVVLNDVELKGGRYNYYYKGYYYTYYNQYNEPGRRRRRITRPRRKEQQAETEISSY